MESISLKLDKSILDEIDSNLKKHRYSTRTEFIRDAIRKKLTEQEKEELLKELPKLVGKSKRKTTDEDVHRARENAFKSLEKKFK